ncbi:MAG: HEAT repeat domain-containing protein [Phycisphaerales bacterium]|nr:HEAT repeat domain-containing protein [Phycisphaerales bacterium]
MKKMMTAVLVLGWMATMVPAADPLAMDDTRIKSLADSNDAVCREATSSLVDVGGPAVPVLVKVLDTNEQPAAKNAYEALFHMSGKWANTPRQAEISKALAEALAADRPAATKYVLCRFLSLVGDGGAVAVLAKAMNDEDPKLREWARWALTRIPDIQAVEALIAQLGQGDTAWRLAVINALAEQANPKALPALTALAQDADQQIQEAALYAIAQLPSSDALNVMRGAVREGRAGAVTAMLDLGENLVDAGMQFEALAAFVPLWNDDRTEPGQRCRILHGLARAGTRPAVSLLLSALNHPDVQVRGAAVQACSLIHGQEELDMLAGKLASSNTTLKIDVLTELGGYGHPEVLPIILASTKDEDQGVRVAAYKAMQELRNPDGFDALLAAFAGQSGPDREAAEVAMLRLDGDSITARILGAYEQSNNLQKASLLWVLSYRQSPEIALLMLKEITNTDEPIRAAAAQSIGRVANINEHMALTQVFAKLFAVAKEGPEIVTAGAVDSLLRLAMRLVSQDRAAAAESYIETLQLAVNDHQRAQALNGLGETMDTARLDLLDLLRPYVFEGTVRKEAATVAAKLAIQLPDSRKDEAIPFLKEAVEQRTDDVQGVLARLAQLGVDVDPVRGQGFITVWWLLGPFPNADNQMWDTAYAPEENVDLAAGVKSGDDTLSWKRWQTLEPNGLVNLNQSISRKTYMGAYGYAEISVDQEQYALFRMGSDDGIVVWLNGEKIHANDTSRGVKVDDDEKPVYLVAGVNRILVKILDKGGDWGFVVRVCTPNGTPLEFAQKTN